MTIAAPETETRLAVAESAPREDRQENCFDFLRLFAAATVVIRHGVLNLHLPFLWVPAVGEMRLHDGQPPYWFNDGVPVFFILSGLLVYLSCDQCVARGRPLSQFYRNRFLRIAPALYAYAVLTPLFLLAVGAISLQFVFTPSFAVWFASNLFFAPVRGSIFASFGTGNINGSLWTIPVEVSFYLVVPVLWAIERRLGRKALALSTSVIALAGIVLYARYAPLESPPTWFTLLNMTFVPYLVFFGLGVLWLRAWNRVPQNAWIAAASLAAYVLVRSETMPLKAYLGPTFTLMWAVPLSYAVVWFGYNGPAFLRRVTRVGDLSYGMYIWHMVVVNAVLYFGVPAVLGPRLASVNHILVTVLTAVIALASWWLVERPALRLKRYSARTRGIA